MNISCIIVDDEPLAVKLLESFVQKTPQLRLEASFTDSVEALAWLREHPVNLAFMDIQMPDMSGMELSHMLPEGTKVIFTTAFKEYAFESYEVKALDFLLKPIRYSKFLAAIDKAREWFSLHLQPSTIFIKVDGELRQLPLDSILYVSGLKDYVMFYITDEKRPLITHMTMKAVEEMLPDEHFMRVNRSYVVALQHIRKVDRNDCIYIGDEIIHVTEAYLPAFQAYLTQRM